MDFGCWWRDDAEIVAQRLRSAKKRHHPPCPASLEYTAPTERASKSSITGSNMKSGDGPTYILYKSKGSEDRIISIIYNNSMCWEAARTAGTRTLSVRNLFLSCSNDLRKDLTHTQPSQELEKLNPSFQSRIATANQNLVDGQAQCNSKAYISRDTPEWERVRQSARIALQARHTNSSRNLRIQKPCRSDYRTASDK